MHPAKVFGKATFFLVTAIAAAAAAPPDDPLVERGRYIVKIADCNGCHTTGYAASGGEVPEADWLLGDQVGFSGPWGTTYPPNLRLRS
jgi:mono/diheme cytochrome c family protein